MHVTHPRVYLDHNATSPLRPAARSAMQACASGGNPSSVHAEGRAGREALEAARATLACAIGARPAEIVLTASATEANNLALKGCVFGASGPNARLLISAVEHASVSETAAWLEQAGLADVEAVGVDGGGRLRLDQLEAALTPETLLLSVVAAQSETGTLQPVRQAAELAHAAGALCHVDAAQALGRIPVSVAEWGADLISLSSHKLGGPRGAGALWVRPGVTLEPLLHGGHQERNRRAGTEDVLAQVGFGAALTDALTGLDAEALRLSALRDELFAALRAAIPSCRRLGDPAHCLPNTLCLDLGDLDAEALLFGLDLAGLAASSGSACTSGSLQASPALLAMGLDEGTARSALRLSLGWSTTAEDVARAAELLPSIVQDACQEAA